MKIMFVCKYNRFRSKIAEAYFNQKNKDKDIKVISAGFVVGSYALNEREVNLAKEMGVQIKGLPKPIRYEDLIEQDLIVIVGDNIPVSVFKSKRFKKEVLVWKIPDVYPGDSIKVLKGRIEMVKNKVDNLIKKLEKKK